MHLCTENFQSMHLNMHYKPFNKNNLHYKLKIMKNFLKKNFYFIKMSFFTIAFCTL